MAKLLKDNVTGDFDKVKDYILSNLDHYRFVSGMDRGPCKLKFGDFVITGINTDGNNVIGYVVQVRTGWGAFGSNMVFIRQRNEELMTHENQSFWKLSGSQMMMVRPFFKNTPVDEFENNPNLEYSVLGKHHASGFIVSGEGAPARTDNCSFSMTITRKG